MSDRPSRNLIKKFLFRCDTPGCWKRGVQCWDDHLEGKFSTRYEVKYLAMPVIDGIDLRTKAIPQRFFRQCWNHVKAEMAPKTQ